MPNIKSAAKRVEVANLKRRRNFAIKSAVKTTIKRFEKAMEGQNLEDAKAAFARATRMIDKAVTKGIIHKNTAARKKSRLAKKLNNMAS